MKSGYTLALLLLVINAYATELPLTITFPDNPDTFALDKMRLSGHTGPGARVFVNNQPVKVYAHGAFVTRVDLVDGHNLVRVRANLDTLQTVREISIYRPPKLVQSDSMHTDIDTLYMEPRSRLLVLPGDYIRVRIKGSPGARAFFSVEDLAEQVPMLELPPQRAMGLKGIYNGVLKVGQGPRNKNLSIKCKLQGRDGNTAELVLPGTVYIMPDELPIVGETLSEAWLQSYATGFVPLSLLPAGVQLHITGKKDSRFRVSLGPAKNGWIEEQDIRFQPWGTDLPLASVSAPVMYENDDTIDLRFSMDQQVPFVLEADLTVPQITATLYGARQASHWVTWPSKEVAVDRFEFTSPAEQVLQIKVVPDLSKVWGYSAEYDERGFHIKIRKPPVTPDTTDSLFLQGWKIVLDPGHGGKNDGAISPSGYLEKKVNLQWAGILRDSLVSYGAQIILTRNTDTTMALRDRVELARKEKAHLFLSLHNNSTTSGGNAESVRGTSVYYYLPQNKALAWAIYPHLLDLGLESYGRIYNSYYVTRVTDMPVLLIEGAFLSHPREELKFTDMLFFQDLSGAIVKGLRDYIQSLATH